MAATITHATVAVGVDAGNGEIRKSHWNASHAISGTIDIANGGTGAATALLAAKGLSVPYIYAQSGNPQSVGAVTTETTLATVSFAGGELGPNGLLIVWSQWSNNNNANGKTVNIRMGGVAGTLYNNGFNTTNVGQAKLTYIVNQNSASSQRSVVPAGNQTGFGGFSSANVTSTVNTASAWDLVFTGIKAVSTDTLTLEGYQVIVCYGA